MKLLLTAVLACLAMLGARPTFAREFDAETGLVHMGYREYDPETGRFLQEDPLPEVQQYAYAYNNPLIYADPLGLAAIYVNYDYYRVSVGGGYHLPLGHGGVVAVDEITGATAYYEYGRYYGSTYGLVRRMPIPDLDIGPGGQPTRESLNSLYAYLSETYGKGAHVSATYYPNSSYAGTIAYAEHFMHDPNRPRYGLLSNNCKTFGQKAATACQNGQSCPW